MRFTALETSSLSGGIAVYCDGACLLARTFGPELDQGRELLPRLRDLLSEVGILPRDLEGVAVGAGPGSYTGIRMGITAAKTLAYALAVPLVAVSSLEVIAAGVGLDRDGGVFVAPLLDGRQDFVYGALFEVHPAGGEAPGLAGLALRLRRLTPDRVAREDELVALLGGAAEERKSGDGVVLAVGDGADRVVERGRWSVPGCELRRGPAALDNARADVLGALSVPLFESAAFDLEEVHALRPAYLRPTEAERRLEEKR